MKPEVDRCRGWDQECNEYFERVTCPVCGYRATYYEKGGEVVEREGSHESCACCAHVGYSAPVTPDDYGKGGMDARSQDDADGCLGVFLALFLGPIVVVLLAVNVFGCHP